MLSTTGVDLGTGAAAVDGVGVGETGGLVVSGPGSVVTPTDGADVGMDGVAPRDSTVSEQPPSTAVSIVATTTTDVRPAMSRKIACERKGAGDPTGADRTSEEAGEPGLLAVLPHDPGNVGVCAPAQRAEPRQSADRVGSHGLAHPPALVGGVVTQPLLEVVSLVLRRRTTEPDDSTKRQVLVAGGDELVEKRGAGFL